MDIFCHAEGCNTAIGDKDNRDVCGLSAVDPCPNSELWIRVCTMLKDAAALSWLGLVKQVLSSKDSCWLASANGVVASFSPDEGRKVLQTIFLP